MGSPQAIGLDHLAEHIRNRGKIRADGKPANTSKAVNDDIIRTMELMIEPLTLTQVAERLGELRPSVSWWWDVIRGELMLGNEAYQGHHGTVERVHLVRIAYGIDPCPRCEI